MRIAAVVPAAGSSSRLGTNKLLVEVGGEPLVRRAVRRALAAGLSPVIAVVGPDSEPVAASLGDLPVEIVVNRRRAEGLPTSIRAGVGAVPPECDGALVLLPDMPLVTAAMLRELCERLERDRPPLVLTLYGDTPAPPMLYARALFPALLAADEGGRQVVRDYRDRAALVRRPASLLVDIDVPADLERLRALDPE